VFISLSTCRRQVEMLGMTKGRVTLPFGGTVVMTASRTSFRPFPTCRRQVRLLLIQGCRAPQPALISSPEGTNDSTPDVCSAFYRLPNRLAISKPQSPRALNPVHDGATGLGGSAKTQTSASPCHIRLPWPSLSDRPANEREIRSLRCRASFCS